MLNNMIKSNASESYVCPICLVTQGIESSDTLMKATDIIYKDDQVTACINSFFVGNNAGHVIVVPNEHYENIYDLPNEVGHRIADMAKKVSLAMKKAYRCDGITMRQNNEPAGDQHAFHYHMHIFPRYTNDGYNTAVDKRLAAPEERAEYAKKLKSMFD